MIAAARDVRTARDRAGTARKDAQDQIREFVIALRTAQIPVRDIAFLLKLTPQRISQIARR
jgi:hypothetical protein